MLQGHFHLYMMFPFHEKFCYTCRQGPVLRKNIFNRSSCLQFYCLSPVKSSQPYTPLNLDALSNYSFFFFAVVVVPRYLTKEHLSKNDNKIRLWSSQRPFSKVISENNIWWFQQSLSCRWQGIPKRWITVKTEITT